MKISDILAKSRYQLEKSGVSSSKLDSLILLAHALSFSKEQIIFNPDLELNENQQNNFFQLIDQRCKRQPVSQIIGRREFFGREFLVTSDVLDPRPDSESLIGLITEKFLNQNQKLNILEIGSGSGCLIITTLLIYKESIGTALDISQKALKICNKNAQTHKVTERLKLTESDIFTQLVQDKKFDLIISNPPYIPSSDIDNLEAEVKFFEPRIALDGGFDGLDFYRRIAREASIFLSKNGRIILEIGYGQKDEIIEIFSEEFLFEEAKKDLASVDRALSFRKKF
jgi:release factor glutamine methyltransferase